MSSGTIWAEPKPVASIDDCYFYHTMDIPGHGTVTGEWDLRGREAAYLGNVDLKGKRVLEVGTASGHLCFAIERMGADVVGYDLSEKQDWDVVPYHALDVGRYLAERREHIRKLNNGWWLAHRANQSKAKVVYGTVYDVPADMGKFDVCTFGSILLHLRDPFLAMQRLTAHVTDTVIVTDVTSRPGLPALVYNVLNLIEAVTGIRLMRFMPNGERKSPLDTWWVLTPSTIIEFLRVLGFPATTVTYSSHLHDGKEIRLFTVVGRRTHAAR